MASSCSISLGLMYLGRDFILRKIIKSERILKRTTGTIEEKLSYRTAKYLQLENEQWQKTEQYKNIANKAKEILHTITNNLSALGLHIERIIDQIIDYKNSDDIYALSGITSRMNSFIGEMRSLINEESKINKRKSSLNESLLTIHDLFKYQSFVEKINISIKQSGDCLLDIHPARLNQLFVDLISNSIQSFEGMKIRKKIVLIETELFNDDILIKITDNGCGIPSDLIHKAGKESFTTKKNGTGTGLMTIFRIVNSELYGKINFESAKNGGTIVKILLPISSK
jgi:signal transduction histidine kinase